MLLGYVAPLFSEFSLLFFAFVMLFCGAFCDKGKTSNSCRSSYIIISLIAVIIAFGVFNFYSFSHIKLEEVLTDFFIFDNLSNVFRNILLIVAVFIILSSCVIKDKSIFSAEFLFLLLMVVVGSMLTISSINFLSMYVSIEMQSIALYIMVASNRSCVSSSEAGLKYFIIGSVGSAFLLYGFSLLYGFGGIISFDATLGDNCSSEAGILAGKAFVLVGMLLKLGVFPFHAWVPDVYQGSSTFTTFVVSLLPKISTLVVLIRFLNIFENNDFIFYALFAIACASLLYSAVSAIKQSDIKRLLGYSAIGHMSYLLLSVVSGNIDIFIVPFSYIIIYALNGVCVFTFLLCNPNIKKIEHMSGMFKESKFSAIVLSICMFSMAGIPPVSGFLAKFLVLDALIHEGFAFVACVIVALSVISAFYYLRIVKVMFFSEPNVVESDVIANNYCCSVMYYAIMLLCAVLNIIAPLLFAFFL